MVLQSTSTHPTLSATQELEFILHRNFHSLSNHAARSKFATKYGNLSESRHMSLHRRSLL